jgi:hypothetical protein
MPTLSDSSINVKWTLTIATPLNSPEYRITTVRAVIAFFLLLHPSLSSKLPPRWYSTQYHLLPNGKREIVD